MVKKLVAIFFLTLMLTHDVSACTTFLISKNGQHVFGRNYDWITGNGMVCTNLRGLAKTSVKSADGKQINWVSKYGSITFNQYGKEFPTGGMNEEGLVVELMWLDGTRYPQADARASIGVLQWVQYQLDNASRVFEVISSDTLLRISSGDTPLHYLVADAKGNAATIEFLNGKMVVHRGNELPYAVLANNTYQESLTAMKAKTGYGDNSISRFSKACNMVSAFQAGKTDMSAVDYAFDVLGKVSQGDYTKWSIVYDISNRRIVFKTQDNPRKRFVNFKGFDFACASKSLVLDMNMYSVGDLGVKFHPYSDEQNRKLIEKSIKESSSHVTVSETEKESGIAFPATVHCDR